jgi:hypothetical protein
MVRQDPTIPARMRPAIGIAIASAKRGGRLQPTHNAHGCAPGASCDWKLVAMARSNQPNIAKLRTRRPLTQDRDDITKQRLTPKHHLCVDGPQYALKPRWLGASKSAKCHGEKSCITKHSLLFILVCLKIVPRSRCDPDETKPYAPHRGLVDWHTDMYGLCTMNPGR